MACNFCTNTFNSYQPLLVTISLSGGNVSLSTGNQSRSIISIYRMLLCLNYPSGGTTILYLRPNFPIQQINQGLIESYMTSVLQYQLSSTATSAQAEAEYVEVNGRSVSCTYP